MREDEPCEFCGYRHSEQGEMAESYHKSHDMPFKIEHGMIKSYQKKQCGGCQRMIQETYKYCIQCAKTKG